MSDQSLHALEPKFMSALTLKEAGKFEKAEEVLRAILHTEPRLPEPHLELARILLDTDRLEAAEGHAQQALDHLEANGPWTDELDDNVVTALAHATLAEILRRRADEDDIIFGSPEAFKELVARSKEHFQAAANLDPQDAYSSYHAFFLGPDGHK